MAITIQKGDTLTSIANKYGTTVQELAKTNNIRNPDLIYTGHTLLLPGDVPAHDHPLGLTQQPAPQDTRQLPPAPVVPQVPAPVVPPAPRDLTVPPAPQPPVIDQTPTYNNILQAMWKASQQDYSSQNAKMDAIRQARYNVGTAPLTDNQKLLDPGALARSQEEQRAGYTGQLQAIESLVNNDKQSNAAKITGLRDLLTATKPQEISPGASLYDPVTGKEIFTAPTKAVLPASAQEYEYAVKNGYKGTYNDYQNMDANRKRSLSVTNNISPTEKASDKLAKNVSDAQDQLNKGITWGAVWGKLYTQYKTGDPAQDKALADYLDLVLDKKAYTGK